MRKLDTWVNLCYALLEGSNPTEENCTMSTIVVTQMARLREHDVPVEALVFNEHCVIYSRMLVPVEAMPALIDAGFTMKELHLSAVMN